MTLIKLYLTINFAVPQKLLQDCTTVNSFSVLQQFTVKTSEHNSVCTVRALKHHTVRKLCRFGNTASVRTKLILINKHLIAELPGSNPGTTIFKIFYSFLTLTKKKDRNINKNSRKNHNNCGRKQRIILFYYYL